MPQNDPAASRENHQHMLNFEPVGAARETAGNNDGQMLASLGAPARDSPVVDIKNGKRLLV